MRKTHRKLYTVNLEKMNEQLFLFMILLCVCVLTAQSCLTLCDPMGCSPPVSSVHGILQARIQEWVAISFSKGSSWPRGRTWISRIAGRFFTIWATSKAQLRDISDVIFNKKFLNNSQVFSLVKCISNYIFVILRLLDFLTSSGLIEYGRIGHIILTKNPSKLNGRYQRQRQIIFHSE